jgi:anaerobic magnesium-protoporphyrin IX monomethyl ester cyclase
LNLLIAINAKYIHTNVAIRSLQANTSHPVELIETTIKDDPRELIELIGTKRPETVGFSVYIWNVSIIQKILESIRSLGVIVILGGPEVSYDAAPWLTSQLADYVIVGEGEVAYDHLLSAIHNQTDPSTIVNVVTRQTAGLPIFPQPIEDLSRLQSPHRLKADESKLASKIQYVETSRGCPFRCSYCLASLDRSVRFFPLAQVQADLLHLMDHGAKTIKFLDRTFNMKLAQTRAMFAFLIEQARDGVVYQFEITGDLMPLELVDYVNTHAPKGLFRFEIGIQSTNEQTNRLVDRIQNNTRLFEVIQRLQTANVVDLHLDLIAGLPEETLERFEQTFNEVFLCRAKEVQLGFLKFLKGTKIRAQAKQHGYQFQQEAPYEIISSNTITKSDLNIIRKVEIILDRAWNKGYLHRALTHAMKRQPSMFAYFLGFYRHMEAKGFDPRNVQLTTFFEQWEYYHLNINPGDSMFQDELRRDYIEHHPIRPKLWWKDDIQRDRTLWLDRYHQANPDVSMDQLHRHTLVMRYGDGVLIARYGIHGKTIDILMAVLPKTIS